MQIAAEYLHGIVLAKRGSPHLACQHLERALELHGPGCRESQLARLGQDCKSSALAWLTWERWAVGYADQGRNFARAAMAHAQQFPHPSRLAWGYIAEGIFFGLSGEGPLGLEALAEARVISTEHGFGFWDVMVAVYQGISEVQGGHPEQGIMAIERGMATLRAMGAEVTFCFFYCALTEGYLALGKHAQAASTLATGLASADRRGEHDWDGELFRLRGELLLATDPSDPREAETWFMRAMELAREQHAKFVELRAACSLARLWRSQGKVEQAYHLLAPIYNWFTEGFDTRDLQEAKALLGELR
jgi:predicted ATPase